MKDRALQIASPLIVLVVWEILVKVGILDVRFFAPPSEIAGRLAQLVNDGTMWRETAVTMRRVLVGFTLASVPAVLLGILMGINRPIRLFFTPLISAMYPVPKIALVPMIILIFGIGETAKYAVSVISVFFLVALNTVAGVTQVDQKYFDIARNSGARGWDLIWTVALPGALPSILTGLNLALGFALTVVVGTELLLPQGGLGALIWQSYQVYDVPTIFATLIVVAVLGWGTNELMGEVERQVIPWRAAGRPVRAAALVAPEPRLRHFIRVWWMATRPFSFTASVTPVALGAALAAWDGKFNLLIFGLVLVGSVAIHAGTNLINDYYDWRKGTDTAESLGPNRPLKEKLVTPRQVLIAGLLCFALGGGIGLYLVADRGGLFILVIGVLSVLAGYFYTAGPAAFAYIGLGEVIVFIFMGPIMVVGSYFMLAQEVPLRVVLLAMPIGMLVAAILHANNMRDHDMDRAKGKRTLSNILGRRGSKIEYVFLVGGAFVAMLALVLLRLAPVPILLTLLAAPQAWKLIKRGTGSEDPKVLNGLVRGSASLHGRFGWLMILGVVLAALG
ncbi:MAG TPA: 1,4-dihydroxy-2-naphthoate octaprenyltransferase [Thermoflexales bacterium]|nr:1,4-dihydroxy-2-naphthoate octaprenyltransferase [Thermoflexales bacterium]HQX12129.1 1,4-dihydroxy-2-naphthoate octaprenyltransferase [Thermoflexales bacterium]HQZ54720.1 1,4-dihydroxy-2-naphthoate octaprenyltransferase [Thermoflexales bacterium]HRA54722.1 1,4-dihydroxy-2-naphthoate octaprenyltransferase [Thermoflexales bacterium]